MSGAHRGSIRKPKGTLPASTIQEIREAKHAMVIAGLEAVGIAHPDRLRDVAGVKIEEPKVAGDDATN